jgi:glycosyltransferase involved in cell wall biosynthesis
MNKEKTISTVIPTFNREIYLKEAILSCLNQTIKNEIIVCNHGGTDGTDTMVKQFEGKIKYIKRNENYGPHFCWLEGILEAKGEYINLLFDDDWIKPKFIEECRPYYHLSKKKYLDTKTTYNSFTTILRQICNFNKIKYVSQIKYDKSKYNIIYYIYIL